MYTIRMKVCVTWVPCHHGMASTKAADGGDGLQMRRVPANILNKQSRTANKVWSSSLGVGRGLTTPQHKKYACYEMSKTVSDFDSSFG
jgi:hypothetical protein